MLARPRPFNVLCSVCDWTQYCHPKSDCFTLKDFPLRCKRCGNTELEGEYGNNLRLKAFLRTHFGLR